MAISRYILNIRCTCEEEYMKLQSIHAMYRAKKREERIERYKKMRKRA